MPVEPIHPSRRRACLLSRRAVLAAAPGAFLLLAGVGCGEDDADGATAPTATPTRGPATPTPAPATPTPAPSGAWSFTDDRGITVSLPQRPQRIVAQTTSAAALWDLGVRPVAIFGPSRTADGQPDFQAGNIDLDSVVWLGDYGELDLEQLVALDADLYVDLAYDSTLWYLGDELEKQVSAIVPTLGITMQKVPITQSIARFEELSIALGADPQAPEVVAAKEAFRAAEADLKAAIAGNPGLTVLVIAPVAEQVYVASPNYMVDLNYFRSLGLDIVEHPEDAFWQILSWEQINTYPADLILTDQREGQLQAEELSQIETWNLLPAVQAGQVGPWYAGAPYSYARLVPIMQELTEIVRSARADIV